MTLSRGTRLGPYEVTALLGSGGMADVYRARDTRLGRDVAIKILPDDISADPESLARFQREARTASRLNHPHLVTIYDIGAEQIGDRRLHYIAMELIRGETLRYHLQHEPREVLLRYIADVADALAKAHDAGIVHRDLKPENVMVSDDNHAKVVDFGLAKHAAGFRSDERIAVNLTEEGLCVGTPGYMAPEQALGLRDLDGRVDIFALGCILYEAIAKENPFEGETAIDTLHRILHHDPPPLADVASEAIVRRCIAKDRAGRYTSMREVATDLRNAIAAPAIRTGGLRKSPIASIAVLPFHNRSGSEEMQFLSDGIPEDVVRSLGRIPTLRVIASSSASRFRDTTDPRQAAKELHVEAVLVGSVRTIGGTAVLDAELVKASDGTALWGKKYTRQMTDLVALEEAIARDVCDELRLELSPPTERDPRPEAYEAYLRGKREVAKETAPALKKGVAYFYQAMELDPEYALPYAAVALVYGRQAMLGIAPTRDSVMQQIALARKALALDEQLPEAHHNLAVAALLMGDMAQCTRELDRTLELNPNHAQAYVDRSVALVGAMRFEEAEAAHRKARELDPLSSRVMSAYAGRLFLIGQWDRCVAILRTAAEQFPETGHVRAYLAFSYSFLGRHREAIELIDHTALETNPNIFVWKGIILARAGRVAEARAIADEVDEIARTQFLLTYHRAILHLELGDDDAAFALLEEGMRSGEWYCNFARHDRTLERLRSDPRFDALLEKYRPPALALV